MTDARPAAAALTIRKPDDWHVHLRDGAMLKAVAPLTAAHFRRAIIMPNLAPPVVTVAQARSYRERILAALPAGTAFEPLMTAYLTEGSDPAEIARGHDEGVFKAVKLYPAHATTNSQHGVADLVRVYPVLETMQRIGLPLLVHGEVTDPEVDVFDRESVFIERVLAPLRRRFPGLKMVLEHITTAEAADFVRAGGAGLAATITPHHLMINRNAIFRGGLRPHYYCLPIAKRERHRLALRRAAISGAACFFLGTDSAPHLRSAKETDCGCAGIFNAPMALAAYATVFAEEGALDRLEAFASLNGPAFYGLAPNRETVTLRPMPAPVPVDIPVADGGRVHVFMGGENLNWTVADDDSARPLR